MNSQSVLSSIVIITPLGNMLAIASQENLHVLHFTPTKTAQENFMQKYEHKFNKAIIPGHNNILEKLSQELENYFSRKNKTFSIPCLPIGTPFQQKVWYTLTSMFKEQTSKIITYQALAHAIENPTAHRAVANALNKNPIALLIPCHRVVRADGSIGGYNGGSNKKQWLLQHEF